MIRILSIGVSVTAQIGWQMLKAYLFWVFGIVVGLYWSVALGVGSVLWWSTFITYNILVGSYLLVTQWIWSWNWVRIRNWIRALLRFLGFYLIKFAPNRLSQLLIAGQHPDTTAWLWQLYAAEKRKEFLETVFLSVWYVYTIPIRLFILFPMKWAVHMASAPPIWLYRSVYTRVSSIGPYRRRVHRFWHKAMDRGRIEAEPEELQTPRGVPLNEPLVVETRLLGHGLQVPTDPLSGLPVLFNRSEGKIGIQNGVYINADVAIDSAWKEVKSKTGQPSTIERLASDVFTLNSPVIESPMDHPQGGQLVRVLPELVAHLRKHSLFRKRTLALRSVLKQKAMKWLSDMDLTEESGLRQVAFGVALAMEPCDEELLSLAHMDSPKVSIRTMLVNNIFVGGRGTFDGGYDQIPPELIRLLPWRERWAIGFWRLLQWGPFRPASALYSMPLE